MTISLGYSQDPATGPTSPTARNAWDVKSLYGGAYTNEAGVIFDSFGGSTIVGDVALGDGNVVKKYTNHLYSGIQVGAGDLNVTSMTKLHIDVYSPGFTSFRIKLEAVNGSNVELDVPGAHSQGVWNSYDLDLSTYAGVDLAHLKWVVPVSYTPPGETLYIDNVYFWRPATSIPSPTITGFSIPTKANGAADFVITAPTSNSTGTFSYSSSNPAVATIVGGSSIHVVGIGDTTITATQAATGSYSSGSTTATFNVTPSAAPNPTASAANVIAIYTDAYPTVEAATVDTFLTSWSAATLSPIVIGTSNNTLKYTNVNYLGIEATTVPINATAMNLFHIDVFTPNMTTFRVKLVDFGANGVFGGGDDSEHELSMTPTLNGWNSYNLLLSSFTGLTARAHIAQIILSGNPAGSGTLYVDNMYFGFAATTILSNFTIPAKVTGDADFAITAPTSTSPGAFTYTSSNPAVATIVSGSSIHIVGVGTSTITATQAASGSYSSGTITASFVVTAPIAQAPTTAAPTPPARNTWDVVSLFSGTYSNITLNELPTSWSQLSEAFEVLSIAGNSTWKFKGEFLGMVTNYDSGVNLAQMTTMHIDYWTPDTNRIDLKLVNTVAGGESFTALEPTTVAGTWRSIDVPLTNYGALNRSNITQILVDPAGDSKIYIDNFYFYRPATSNPSPTITNFTVPSKLVGAPAFTLTAPTSNSTGAFTYTSSNTAVATISGSTVTVIGAGISIITATQTATGSYSSGAIAANLVVSFPPPTVAAATPTVPADRVLSIFSDAYTNEGGAYYPYWGQAAGYLAPAVVQIGTPGNNTLKVDNLSYQGVQLTSNIDVSAMTTLHVDIWTPNCTTFEFYLIDSAPVGVAPAEQAVSVSPTQNGWNSIDIPMSSYNTLALTGVQQFKLVGTPTGSIVYLDNIYFTKPTPRSIAPTVADVNYCKGSVATPLTATGFTGNALKWYTVGGTTLLPTYTLIAAGAPTPLTSTVGSKKYAVSQVLSNGVDSPKAIITVTINALPTEVLGTITSNTAGTTAGTYLAATTAVGQYVGTTTPVTYRVPAFVDTTLTYFWTVPTGVNIVSQTANTLTVNFFNVTSGIGAVGSITVQAQNASGCRTVAKSVALTKVLPTAPAAIKMTDALLPVPTTGIPTAVTSFAKYMGTSRVVTLTATPSTTATSYVWELPTGVNQLSGGTSNVITVNFLGVTSSNTFNYLTLAGVSTNVVRIGVKSRNGVGDSTTSNAALVNPTTTSTAKLLTLTAVKPAAVTAVSGQIAGLCGGTTYTYTITDTALASSYSATAPAGCVVNFTSTLTFTVTYPVGFNITTTTAVADKTIYVTSINGMGISATTKALTLSTAMAAIGANTNSYSYVVPATGLASAAYFTKCAPQTITVPAVPYATSYVWTLQNGATGTSTTNSIVVNFSAVSPLIATTKNIVKVKAVNACGVFSAEKSITLSWDGITVCGAKMVSPTITSDVSIYPNPAKDNFNLELTASEVSEMSMTIYNMNGAIVRTKNLHLTEGNNVINEDISSLASGIYFVRFNNPTNNETITKKLIKE